MTAAEVVLWGRKIGTIVSDNDGKIKFSYDKDFSHSGIEIAPIQMPLSNNIYQYPNLVNTSFCGVPGLLADSLPDTFGNYLINEYLAMQGREDNSMNPVEKLLYIGSRGGGALEYKPAIQIDDYNGELDVNELTQLAEKVLNNRKSIDISTKDEKAMKQLLQVSSSTGGSRAKAYIAWNESTNSIRSGQINAGEGYSYWLLKFDSVQENENQILLPNNREYTKIEYAYYLMASKADINMSECRLYKDNGCSHFITKRFDRTDDGKKMFMQSLAAIGHYDYEVPRTCSYEQMAIIMSKLSIPQVEKEQTFRRIVFNELSKNYDDHVKNIAFLMDKTGEWSISPAYDITFAFNRNNQYISKHQMLLNGKSENLTISDFIQCGSRFNLSSSTVQRIISEVAQVVNQWPSFAEKAGVSEERMNEIRRFHNEMINTHDKSIPPSGTGESNTKNT